jgi:hypothetical protein
MAKSLLAAVHNAVAGTVDDAVDDSETGAPALHHKEGSMAVQGQPAGGDSNPGISQAAHDAAVTAARSEGETKGAQAATERLSAALGAEGVKGDAGRMAAALDLAVKSPGMSGADVAAFVTANVAASKPAAGAAADYAQNRAAAASLAQPETKTEKGDKSALAAAVATTNKRR